MLKPVTSRTQRGVTLIELLISAVLGLIVLLGISSIFMMSTRVSNRTKNQIELDNQANIVLERLKRDIYRAGYLDVVSGRNIDKMLQANNALFYGSIARVYDANMTGLSGRIASPFSLVTGGAYGIYGCQPGKFLSDPKAISDRVAVNVGSMKGADLSSFTNYDPSAILGLFTCTGDGQAGESGITLGYQTRGQDMAFTVRDSDGNTRRSVNTVLASSSSLNPDEFTGEGYDCEGTKSPDTDHLYVFNTYYVAKGGLRCRGGFSAGGEGVLISNRVRHLNFRYRLTLPSALENDSSAKTRASGSRGTGYAAAGVINASSGSDAKPNWNFVTAVEVCMVMAGGSSDGTRDITATADQDMVPTCTWDNAAAGYGYVARPAGDNALYKRYIANYTVPNLVYASPVGQVVPIVDNGGGANPQPGSGGANPQPGGGANPQPGGGTTP